jgi:protein-S-isoprenylcysteine O-methyltransferase Ste14
VWLALCVLLCVVGVAVMIAADAQKTFTLRAKPGLITDGMFRYVRHPNYLGEMMIYASFAMLVQHWLPWVVLAAVWSLVFAPSLVMKEQSLSRHPGWAAYRARTKWLIPGLF